MGNNPSKIIELDFTNDALIIKYDTDSESINMSTKEYIKTYITYYCVNGISKTYILTIKIMESNIFIYVTDMSSHIKKAKLAYVANINSFGNEDDTKHTKHMKYTKYMKYIQVSQDFKLISLPDNDILHVYDLYKLLDSNVLEYVNTIGSFDKVNHYNPYKCILSNGIYIILYVQHDNIHTQPNTNNGILILNYSTPQITYNNMSLDNIMSDTIISDNILIRLSTNGYYCILCDKNAKNISICNFKSEKPTFISINININTDTDNTNINTNNTDSNMLQTIDKNKTDAVNISNDGKLIFLMNGDKCVFYDTCKMRVIKIYQNHLRGLSYQLLDYNEIIDSGMTNISRLYVLVGWNQSKGDIYYWYINHTNTDNDGCELLGPYYLKIAIHGTIEYIYNNNDLFIYKTNNELTIYDLRKVIPLRFIDILRKNAKKELDTILLASHKKYGRIKLLAADESIMEYDTNNYMQYMMAESNDNMFKLRVNANMSLYHNTKSFQIYQGLLAETINYDEILDGIFSIIMVTGIHNMMSELMDHMYEYARVIGLGETQDGNITRSKVNNLKALYIGYVLLLLVLKYYSKLYIYITRQNQIQHNQIQYNQNYHDLIETFTANFPAFEGFIKKTYIYSCFNKSNKTTKTYNKNIVDSEKFE